MRYLSKKLLFLAILIGQLVHSQNRENVIDHPELLAEQVYIHHNSSFFLPGEKLYYSLYNLNERTRKKSQVSKIARVLLIDSNKRPVFSHALNLDKGASYSDFLIPSDIPTGTYKLVGYTNWMTNYENPGIFEADIFILNPYLFQQNIADKNSTVNSFQKAPTNSNKSGNSKFAINLPKSVYGKREEVNLHLNLSAKDIENANLSMSVRKMDTTLQTSPTSSIALKKKQPGSFTFKNLPEYRGQNLKGKVLDSNSVPIKKELNLQFTVTNRPEKIRIFNTENDATYNFQLSDVVDYTVAQLSVVGELEEKYQLQRDSVEMDFEDLDFPKISSMQLDQDQLEQRMIHHQIDQYYGEVKSDSIISLPDNKVFYGKRGTKYVLDDYTRFTTMQETFVEILNFVSFYSRRKNPEIKIAGDQSQNISGGIPLVLVDGLVVSDHSQIYEMNPATVESITVLQEKYNYGPAFYQGILDIKTKNQNFVNRENSSVWKLQASEKRKEYYNPEYTGDQNSVLSRVPDYRYQLIWIPVLTSKEIEFYTSDISGIFEIRVEGFLESGEAVSISQQFSVSEK